MKTLIERVKKYSLDNEVEESSIFPNGNIWFELSGFELEVTADNDEILRIIVKEISDGDEVTDEDVQTYLDALEE